MDVRFLPNPYYVDGLRAKTGNDKEIQDYVMQFPEANEFIDKLDDMIKFLIPNYISEGKNHLHDLLIYQRQWLDGILG